MANRPKTMASTYRFTPDDLALIDLLAQTISHETGLDIARADAIRVAVRSECSRRGLTAPEKKSGKNGKSA